MSLEIRRLRGLPLFLALWTAGFLLLSPVTGKAQESSGTADETSQEDTGRMRLRVREMKRTPRRPARFPRTYLSADRMYPE